MAIKVAATVPLEVRSLAPVRIRSRDSSSTAPSSATMIHQRGRRPRLTAGVAGAVPVTVSGTLMP